jgi:dethiobiotin synthetase
MSPRYFISGIGTNIGKTFVATVLTEALQADYWKPIQSGTIEGFDSKTVRDLVSNTKSCVHNEIYCLKEPLSPHAAADLEGITIELSKIEIPKTDNTLLIEGAGGLLVPLNSSDYVIDLATHCDAEIILVIGDYLGCINHTLLSFAYLKQTKSKVKGIILNGHFTNYTRNAILHENCWSLLAELPELNTINSSTVSDLAKTITPF